MVDKKACVCSSEGYFAIIRYYYIRVIQFQLGLASGDIWVWSCLMDQKSRGEDSRRLQFLGGNSIILDLFLQHVPMLSCDVLPSSLIFKIFFRS